MESLIRGHVWQGEVGAVHLYVLKTVHHGQEQYGRRANGDIELSEPGATLKAVPHRARMQDGTSDHVPR
jgi:hypothetical protein